MMSRGQELREPNMTSKEGSRLDIICEKAMNRNLEAHDVKCRYTTQEANFGVYDRSIAHSWALSQRSTN